ncbi:MAG: hypothetical protein O4808_08690, partial [Trichodesmium sp. St17_bin3_1_1]|nr:hypothetical protein [Trichodesmium sp. St17_bin3_1_1]
IDEATMLDRFHLEALDRTFRDLMGNQKVPFGGKIVILAGDFRQCLPVIPGATRAGTVGQCINKSYLWNQFSIYQLSENLRVKASGNRKLIDFDNWTLSIGNGSNLKDSIEIPHWMSTAILPNTKENSKNEESSMKRFCEKVFPDLETNLRINGDYIGILNHL